MKNQIENDFANFWIENDILHFVYKDGVSLDEAAAIKLVDDRLYLQRGKPFLILCDLRGLKSIDKGARNYFAKEGAALIKAVAVIVNIPLTSVISGFFIKTNTPSFEIQSFTKEEDALKFLNSLRSK